MKFQSNNRTGRGVTTRSDRFGKRPAQRPVVKGPAHTDLSLRQRLIDQGILRTA